MTQPTPAELAVDRYIDRLMRGDAPDVERYIADHPELGPADVERLRKLARAIGKSTNAGAEPTRVLRTEPPDQIGSYRRIERLGAGGMGIVYLAEDVRLGRQVALKIIRPELAGSPDALARFEREARAVAKLQHESIVTVFEAGREGELAYLAMEFVRGESLDEILARARREQRHVPVNDLVRWTRDIARGLQAAHELGIVHRDVKPSNVRITPEGRALLLDFGLAFDADSASISRTGQLHGTVFYVSPEQVNGGHSGDRSAKVDARTDVWSLGVTLYEGLTGRVPFGGEHSQEILYRILSSEPIAPRVLAPELSRDLETVVLAALEKDRERRCPSAAAFAEDLTAVLENRPVRARPSGPVTRAIKWSRRKPAHASALALALLVVVGGPIVYGVLAQRHATELAVEKQIAIDERKLAEARASDLEKMTRFQAEMFDRVDPAELGKHVLESLRAQLREAWKQERVDVSEIDARLAQLDAWSANVDTTNVAVQTLRRDMLEPAIAETEKKLVDRPKAMGMALHTLAATAWTLGMPDLALSTQQSAYDVLVANVAEDDEERLSAAANLGYYLLSAGKLEESEPLLALAAEGLARVAGPTDERAITARNNTASLLRLRGQFDESERVLREVLALRRSSAGDDDPQTLLVLSNLGALVNMRGRAKEAEPLVREAYERRRRVLGPDDDSTLTSANNLAVLDHGLGRLAEAELVFRDAQTAARARFGERHPLTAVLGVGLAEVLGDEGCVDEGIETLTRSLDVQREILGPVNAETLYSTGALGELLRNAGRWDEGEALLLRAYAEVCASIGEAHRSARGPVSALGRLLRDEGRFEEAATLFEHLERAAIEQHGPASDVTQRMAAERVRTMTKAKRHADGAQVLDAAEKRLAPEQKRHRALVDAAKTLYEAWSDAPASADREGALARWKALAP